MALKDIEVQKFFDRKKAKLNIELDHLPSSLKQKNQSQSGVKPEPKWSQTRAKVESQPEPRHELSGAKVEPIQ